MRKILAIARYTLLEAARSRLVWLVLGTIFVFSATSFLIRELAITDSLRLQTAFLATSLRAASFFLI
ncbi:MAG: ABC transporter permease, partial [Burkholderiales bacterium]|nr:ABC transporter permease [Burkholderiales bacterium]